MRSLWFAAQAPGFPYPSPLVSGDTVFFASGGGEVVAREIGSGRSLWTSRIGPSQYSVSPEIQGENFVLRNGILVTAAEYHTSALNTQDGHEIWRYHAPLDTLNQTAPRPGLVLRAHIAADDNTVFIPAWGASVSAVDIRTGSAKWVWRVDPTVSFRSGAEGVQLAGDTAYVTVWHFLNESGTRSEAWVIALDKISGEELWRVVLPKESSGVMVNSPSVSGRLVIVTTTGGDTYAIDRYTRQIAWQVAPHLPGSGLGTAVITPAQAFTDVVYASGSDRMIRAYRAADGIQIWESDAGQIDGDILVTDKFVYAQDGASLYIIDRATGARYAALGHPRKSSSYSYTSGASADRGRIFVTLSDGAWSFSEP